MKRFIIWFAFVVSFAGDEFAALSLTFRLSNESSGSMAVGALLISQFLPRLILGPHAGALSDRFGARRCLIAALVAQAALMLGMVAVVEAWPAVVVLAFLGATVGAVAGPATSSLVGRSGRSDADVKRVSASLEAAANVALLVGPGIGGLLVLELGVRVTLAIDAATFAAAGLCIALLVGNVGGDRGLERGRGDGESQTSPHVLRSYEAVSKVLPAMSLAFLASAATNVAFVFLVRLLAPSRPEIWYGVLAGSWGAGSLVGAGLIGWRSTQLRAHVGRWIALMGLALCLSGLAPNAWVIVPLWLVGGAANAAMNIEFRQLIFRTVPSCSHGRAFGELGRYASAAVLLGLVVGALVSRAHPRGVYVVGGSGTLAFGLAAVGRSIRVRSKGPLLVKAGSRAP